MKSSEITGINMHNCHISIGIESPILINKDAPVEFWAEFIILSVEIKHIYI